MKIFPLSTLLITTLLLCSCCEPEVVYKCPKLKTIDISSIQNEKPLKIDYEVINEIY